MNLLPLRAREAFSKKWYTFSLQDVPVSISDGLFILLAKPNSPKLLLNEIHCGDPDYNVFEGDYIIADGVGYIICYSGGFYAINDSGVRKYLSDFMDIQVVGDYSQSPMSGLFRSVKVPTFKYRDLIFRLSDVTCGRDDYILVQSLKEPIPLRDVRQSCRYNKLFFGDLVDDREVELHHGRVAVQRLQGYYDLSRKEMVKCT